MAHWGWEVIIKGSSWTKTIVVEATVFLSSGMGLRIASSPCLFIIAKISLDSLILVMSPTHLMLPSRVLFGVAIYLYFEQDNRVMNHNSVFKN